MDLAPIMFPLSFKYIKLCILYFDRTFQLLELKMLTWSTLTPKNNIWLFISKYLASQLNNHHETLNTQGVTGLTNI